MWVGQENSMDLVKVIDMVGDDKVMFMIIKYISMI